MCRPEFCEFYVAKIKLPTANSKNVSFGLLVFPFYSFCPLSPGLFHCSILFIIILLPLRFSVCLAAPGFQSILLNFAPFNLRPLITVIHTYTHSLIFCGVYPFIFNCYQFAVPAFISSLICTYIHRYLHLGKTFMHKCVYQFNTYIPTTSAIGPY